MILENINPFAFDWDNQVAEKVTGETGFTTIRTQNIGAIKLRQVEYSANYLADHWCDKGHIVFVISGQLIIEHKDQTELILNNGSTYVVGDHSMPHKSKSAQGALVLIVD